MASKINPCNVIKMDKFTNTISLPSIILMNRNGKKYGKLRYDNYKTSFVGVGIDEISFDVYKYENGKENPLWDKIVDLKIIEVEDYGRFQISVSYTDSTETVKSINAQSLEVELGQLYLNDFHINDDEDMDMEYNDYTKYKYDENGNFIPITFYNPENEMRSLLHLVLRDKAPHWSIGHVPKYLARDEESDAELATTFQRTYTEDGTDIYSFLTDTVAKESNVVFIFDTVNRVINCYSLIDCYITDKVTGEKTLVESAIGEDTTIFISKQNLAQEISIESNKDNVKNCFRVTGGDDIINSRIAAVNLNGTNYIWKFAPFQLEDMSEELKNAISEYQSLVSTQEIQNKYYGDEGIYTKLCEQYKQKSYYESEMMPKSELEDVGTAKDHWNNLITAIMQTGYIYVNNLSTYTSTSHVGIDNMVEDYMNILIDSRYELELIKDENIKNNPEYHSTSSDNGTWWGKVKLTQRTNPLNTYPLDIDGCSKFHVVIRDSKKTYGDTIGEIEFAQQKLEKALYKADMSNIVFDYNASDEKITEYFEQYCLNMLKSFKAGYDSCRSILMTELSGIDDDVTKGELDKLYKNYNRIYNIVESVIKHRESQLTEINSKISSLSTEQKIFQDELNFQKFLENKKEGLYKEFSSYRREENYNNSNYISDNLETEEELLNHSKALLDDANKELSKACMLNRTISTTLNNLLVLPEFEKLYESFALFNYIRIRTEDEILKLRIMGIEFDGNSVENIGVTFSENIESIDGNVSDLQSILDSAQSIASSYSAVMKQAQQGSSAKTEISTIISDGLNAAKTMMTNDDSEEVTITSAGINCKRNDGSGLFGDKQLRLTGNGIYFTDDAWKSIREAIGEIILNGKEYYGIIAEAIVGKLIMGEHLIIGDEDSNVQITKDGIVIKKGTITWDNVNSPSSNSDISFGEWMSSLLGIDTTIITEDTVIAPKIGGGYGYFVDGNNYIILNPGGGTVTDKDGNEKTSDNMVEIISNNNDVFHIDKSGNLSMKGNVDATNLVVVGSYRIKSPDFNNAEVKVVDIREDSSEDTCMVDIGRLTYIYGTKITGFNKLRFYDRIIDGGSSNEYLERRAILYSDNFVIDNGIITIMNGKSLHINPNASGDKTGIYNDYSGQWLIRHDREYDGNVLGNSNEKLSIASNGEVAKNGNADNFFLTKNTSSDRRLKEHRGDLTELEEFYMDLNAVEYNFHKGIRNNPKIEFGFYAQDIIQNFEDKGIDWQEYGLVSKETIDISSEERKYLDDTCPDGIYRLSYNNMIAFNTHMTQKALRNIEALEERCSLLEEQNELLKQEIEVLKKESN